MMGLFNDTQGSFTVLLVLRQRSGSPSELFSSEHLSCSPRSPFAPRSLHP